MTYQQIKSFINTYIVQNGVNAITGSQLNTILNELADYKGFDSVVVTTLPAGSDATATVQGMTLMLGIPKGADGQDAINPFKGWFDSLDELKASYIASVGDSAYVKDASPATTWSIYVYDATASSDNYWADSGQNADTSNVQTFASGEEVNEVHIVNDLITGGSTDVASAETVKVLNTKIVDLKNSTINKTQIFPESSTPVAGVLLTDGEVYVSGPSTIWRYLTFDVDTTKNYIANLSCSYSNKRDCCAIQYFDDSDNFLGYEVAVSQNTYNFDVVLTIPQGATKCRIQTNTNHQTSALYEFVAVADIVDGIEAEIGYFYDKNIDILGIVAAATSYNYRIQVSTNAWQSGTYYISYILDISTLRIGSLKVTANNNNIASIAFLKSDTIVNGETPDYAENTGINVVNTGQTATFNIPEDAIYLYVQYRSAPVTINWPDALTVDGRYYLIGKDVNEELTPSQGINYFEVDINTNVLPNGSSEESNIDTNTTVKSAFGVRFPANYTPDGEPCRVMAMFHGYNGYVTSGVLGYTNSNGWVDFQDVFVNAGFVVFDINGYGLNYNNSGNDNHHWGGPGAILTVKKAFDFLKNNYNVKEQMVVYGFSMGGQIGFSYAMNYPEDVIAVALHEPALPTNNGFLWTLNDIDKQTFADAYGYTDWNAAVADNFANFVGYSIPLSLQYYLNGVYDANGITNLDLSTTLPSGVTLSGHIDCPIRIWQGEKKNNVGEDRVKKALVENIVTALRNGGSNVTARYCPGIKHSELKQTQYVVDETLYFLNRYK